MGGAGPAIYARGISKSFGRQRVLDGLSVQIPSGITYCLLGANGSGKTTFIRAAVGLLRLDGGELSVLGRPVGEVGKIYSQIGYMTQHKALYPDLTVQENMEFYAGLYGLTKKEREERMSDLLQMVDLAAQKGRLAGALSGGMYQRLSLACTLIHQPRLLLLDEPTVGVDPRLRQSFWEYFNRLAEDGKTVLITTHLMDEAEKCRRVGYMRAGRMAAEGSPEEILSLAGLSPILKLWLAGQQEAAALLTAEGYPATVREGVVLVELRDRSSVKEILALVEPLDMRLVEPTLEEAFVLLAEER
ncbi:MAG TPA: ABC transporter ATP-binding protein [Methanothrix sp.]|nr:ABC transporter ATP-binding protein [Methanothrix sp.]HPT19325.1 ABC transporter ATP-binding protein [Methanothrix sp.]